MDYNIENSFMPNGFPNFPGGPSFPGRPGSPIGPGGPAIPNPPQFSPGMEPYRVDPGSIRYCLFRITRIRLQNGRRFLFYPVYLSRNTVAGYRWAPRRNRWVYTGIDLDRIVSFSC